MGSQHHRSSRALGHWQRLHLRDRCQVSTRGEQHRRRVGSDDEVGLLHAHGGAGDDVDAVGGVDADLGKTEVREQGRREACGTGVWQRPGAADHRTGKAEVQLAAADQCRTAQIGLQPVGIRDALRARGDRQDTTDATADAAPSVDRSTATDIEHRAALQSRLELTVVDLDGDVAAIDRTGGAAICPEPTGGNRRADKRTIDASTVDPGPCCRQRGTAAHDGAVGHRRQFRRDRCGQRDDRLHRQRPTWQADVAGQIDLRRTQDQFTAHARGEGHIGGQHDAAVDIQLDRPEG